MKPINLTYHNGQMLIEVVVALGIIGLVLVGVSDLMTRSVGVVNFQRQKSEALSIINKRLTDYKRDRDTDSESFYASAGDSVIDPCEAGKSYKCIVTMTKTADSVNILITAEWLNGGKTYSTSLSQSLTRDIR